jgi:hypothetical protein
MGTTTPTPLLESLLDEVRQYIDQWKTSTTSKTNLQLRDAFAVIIDATDDFVMAVDNAQASGADKKAAVEAALAILYVDVVQGLLPVYLKPFSSGVQAFVFDSVVDPLVDYLVSLHHGGTLPTTTPAPAPTPAPAS